METIDEILKMNGKHPPGRRSRSITDLCARVGELEIASERLAVCATAALNMCERMAAERARLVTCAGAAIDGWVEGEERTRFDGKMAAMARLLIEMEERNAAH